MINLDSLLKSRGTALPTRVYLVKDMVLPVVIYGCESWTVKKAEYWRIDVFKLWCWRKLLWVTWTARRSNQSILKESESENCSAMSNSLQPHELQHTRLPVLYYLPEFVQTHVRWVGDAIPLSHPLLSPSPLALNLSKHEGLFQWVDSLNQVLPMNEYSGLISFRIDWFDLLAVQRTLKGLLQHHSSIASVLQHSAFFMVQLSYPYPTTEKTIALSIQTFVG